MMLFSNGMNQHKKNQIIDTLKRKKVGSGRKWCSFIVEAALKVIKKNLLKFFALSFKKLWKRRNKTHMRMLCFQSGHKGFHLQMDRGAKKKF